MHYFFTCRSYPEFAMNIPALMKSLKDAGRQFPSGVVHFRGGMLRTEDIAAELELTQEQEDLIAKAIRSRKMRPVFGVDVKEIIPGDKRKTCPYCGELVHPLTKHLKAKHPEAESEAA